MSDAGVTIGSGVHDLSGDPKVRRGEKGSGEAKLAAPRVGPWTVWRISRRQNGHLPKLPATGRSSRPAVRVRDASGRHGACDGGEPGVLLVLRWWRRCKRKASWPSVAGTSTVSMEG